MKNSKQLLSRIASFTGIALGAFALSALAANWTPPSKNPPEDNVSAPINVGSIAQFRSGAVGIGTNKTSLESGDNLFEVAGKGLFYNLGVTGTVISNTVQTKNLTITDAASGKYLKTGTNGAVVTADLPVKTYRATVTRSTPAVSKSSCSGSNEVAVGVGWSNGLWLPFCSTLSVTITPVN